MESPVSDDLEGGRGPGVGGWRGADRAPRRGDRRGAGGADPAPCCTPGGCCSCCAVNRRLVPVKMSYFFTLAAVGTLLPYLSVYMKQLGLTPSETALIYGSMPFLGALVRPVVGALADKLHQHKATLMVCCMATGLLHAGLLFVPPVSSTRPDIDTSSKVSIECQKDNSVIKYCTDTRTVGQDCYVPPESLMNVTGTTPDPFLNSSECKLQCEFLVPEGSDSNGICFTPFRLKGQSQPLAGSQEGGDRKDCMSGPWNANGSAPELEFVLEELNHTLTQYKFEEGTGKSLVCHSYSMSAFLFNGTSYQKLFCDRLTHLQCHVECDRFSHALTHKSCTEDLRDYSQKFGHTFQLFFLIDLLANIAFAPIFSLIDAMTYDFLGEERGKWGKQRLWGTIGFAMFGGIAGVVMELYSVDKMNIDYTVSFIAFAVLNVCAAIAVCQYRISGAMTCSTMGRNICVLLRRPEVLSLFVLVFCFGMINGVMETFLFWYLQNMGASRILMGWCIVMNCLPEIPVLFISGWVIKKFGNVKCLCLVCVAFSVRFTAYAFLTNPWYVLAIEPLQGITFGLMYAAASSYASLITPPGMHGTMQGLVGGLYFGVGKGTGSVLGGLVFEKYGAVNTFLGCAGMAGGLLVFYLTVQLCLACRDHRHAKLKQKMEEREAAKAKEEEVKMLNTPIGWGPTDLSSLDGRDNHEIPRYANGMVRDAHSRTPLVLESPMMSPTTELPLVIERPPLVPESTV